MISINMMSQADTVQGHGVLSAHDEQVSLMKSLTPNPFIITENQWISADVTHFHTINPSYYVWAEQSKRNGASVASVHFLPETVDNSLQLPKIARKTFYAYMISFYKRMDILVTVNPHFIEKLMDYKIPRERIECIPNFVSSKEFHPVSIEEKKTLRRKNNLPIDTFTVVCVGQLQRRKGFFDFMTIAELLPEVQFVWAGDFTFGQISDGYRHIKATVDKAPPNVRFTGLIPRERMSEIYNLADLMFLPSLEELLPMSLLEAMSCHIPILVRNLDEYQGMISDYATIGENNTDFINAITLLEQDPTFYQEATQKAINGSLRYSPESIGKQWISFYEKSAYIGQERKKRHKKNSFTFMNTKKHGG